ncbi:MAG: DUF1786 domain-containing protein [Deltaproteobacteria bacterium]|nr:DUF1786 domain-containing protein [Deltaproteobacteria bacterium]
MDHSPEKNDSQTILILDIGGGTQDLLVLTEGGPLENALQCILPSPTVMIARKINQATRNRKAVFLSGRLMGGGASSQAVRDHLQAGLPLYALPQAALTLRDDLQQVAQMGIQITDSAPAEAIEIELGDIQEAALAGLFGSFGLVLPDLRLVAVQDHGFAPQESNRRFRFKQWEDFLASGKPLETLLYQDIPAHLTRMKAVQETWPQALVMDTGAAAILGALEDEQLIKMGSPNILIINIGNEHTLGAWMVEGRLAGIFEHHTFFLNREKLLTDLKGFVSGKLTNEQVLQDEGHGCLNNAPWKGRFPPLIVTGPRRGLLARARVLMAAPFGNMMLSGCFGLLRAYRFGKEFDGLKSKL